MIATEERVGAARRSGLGGRDVSGGQPRPRSRSMASVRGDAGRLEAARIPGVRAALSSDPVSFAAGQSQPEGE